MQRGGRKPWEVNLAREKKKREEDKAAQQDANIKEQLDDALSESVVDKPAEGKDAEVKTTQGMTTRKRTETDLRHSCLAASEPSKFLLCSSNVLLR
eukprot:233909-Rhodomonas_salina.1